MHQENAHQIAKQSKSSFYYAFSLLPLEQRDAMNTVYAFCRKTDDIVDEGIEPSEIKALKLRRWRIELENAFSNKSELQLLNKVAGTISRFQIPVEHFFELIRGVEMDLSRNRFDTFDQLRVYCYRVASTVGLICIEIFGYKHESAKLFAENLGIALQLTNILRDLKKDAKNNRIYLPREEMEMFGYSEEDLLAERYNENFVRLMEFQTARAKDYFRLATSHLHLEDKRSMFAARAMQHIYYRILERIIQARYDVFNQTIRISKFEKFGISLGVWAKYRLVY